MTFCHASRVFFAPFINKVRAVTGATPKWKKKKKKPQEKCLSHDPECWKGRTKKKKWTSCWFFWWRTKRTGDHHKRSDILHLRLKIPEIPNSKVVKTSTYLETEQQEHGLKGFFLPSVQFPCTNTYTPSKHASSCKDPANALTRERPTPFRHPAL